jgi:hypothetical protein
MFDTLVVSVGFVVDGLALGRGFHRGLRCYSAIISGSSLHTHLSSRNSIATI